MGTYTTNYNLFMPTVGEQGWGELVNGNFTIIDATMKGFDDVLSKMTWDGDNVTFPGNVIINGSFSGAVVDYIGLNGYVTTTNTGVVYSANAQTQLATPSTSVQTFTVADYTYNSLPIKVAEGMYFIKVNDTDNVGHTRTVNIKNSTSYDNRMFYFKKSSDSTYTEYNLWANGTISIIVEVGETYDYRTGVTGSWTFYYPASTLYLKSKAP